MKKFLVIGDPIEHSLSPKLHNYWFKQNNVDAVYEKKKVNELELTLFAFNSARFLEIISGVAPSAIKLSLIGSSSTFD